MLINFLVIIIYISFIFDLLIWPISSEASTKSLVATNERNGIIKKLGLVLIFLLNLAFYLFPLIIAILNVFYSIIPNLMLFIPGIALSILGRIISLKGTIALRSYNKNMLMTESVFKISRNPISAGMHLTILGLIMSINEWYLWLGFILYFLNIHFKIKVEERYLIRIYGDEYRNYMSNTARYLIW